jgi:nitrogen fixation NifU-like protein
MNSTRPEKDQLSRLYRDIIMQHAQNPVGFRKAIRETHRNEQYNPLCGDRILLMLEVDDTVVVDAAFDGESCVICKASASLLCEQAPGQSTGKLADTYQCLEQALQGEEIRPQCDSLLPLLGVRQYPSRIRCALLPWEALVQAF